MRVQALRSIAVGHDPSAKAPWQRAWPTGCWVLTPCYTIRLMVMELSSFDNLLSASCQRIKPTLVRSSLVA